MDAKNDRKRKSEPKPRAPHIGIEDEQRLPWREAGDGGQELRADGAQRDGDQAAHEEGR